MRTIFAYIAIVLGLASAMRGVLLVFVGRFSWGSHFSPEGRDGGMIFFFIVVGLLAAMWGMFELKRRNDG